MSPLKTLLLLLVVVGGIGLIITLSIVLTRDHTTYDDCNPANLEPITYMNTTAGDDGLEISWNRTESLGTCNFTYQVVLTTDLGNFVLTSEEPHIVISRDLFCFHVELVIQAVAGGRAADIGTTRVTYGISPVDDLELNVFNANSTVRATWGHVLEGRCGISYEVMFQLENIFTYAFTTSVLYTNFPLFYCGKTTVYLNALRPDGVASERRNTTHSEGYPTSLRPVENVHLNVSETSAVLSWDASNFVVNCDNLYNVTATNNVTSYESACQGTTGCQLSLVNGFCPTTIFSIRPTSDPEGEEVIEIFTCEPVP